MSDETETVFVRLNGSSGSTQAYHTEEPGDCPYSPPEDSRTERDRATLDEWGWSECSFCAEEHPIIHGNQDEDADDDEDEGRDQRTPLRERVKDPDDPIQELMSDD